MKIEYDPEVDALYIRFANGEILDSDQIAPGVILDLDASDNVLGIELLYVTKRYALDVNEVSIHARVQEDAK